MGAEYCYQSGKQAENERIVTLLAGTTEIPLDQEDDETS